MPQNWTRKVSSLLVFAALGLGARPAAAVDVFVPISPCRVYDTRADQDLVPGGGLDNDAPSVAHFNQRTALIAGHPERCLSIDPAATSVAINVLVVNPQTRGFLSMYPEDSGFNGSSFMNFAYWAGDVANPVDAEFALQVGGIMDLDDDGEVAFFWQATKSPPDVANPVIDVAIDVTGYFVELEAGTGLVTSGNGLAIDTPYQLPQAGCTGGEVVTSDGLGGWSCEPVSGGGGGAGLIFDKGDVYEVSVSSGPIEDGNSGSASAACNDATDIAIEFTCEPNPNSDLIVTDEDITNWAGTTAAADVSCDFQNVPGGDTNNGNGHARIYCLPAGND